MSYLFGTNVELIYSLNSPITTNTYTAAKSIVVPLSAGTQDPATIPTSFWGTQPVGKGLFVHASGTIANTTAATFIGQIGLDPTLGTLANSITYWPILAPTAATTTLWDLEAWYTCTQGGAAGSFQANLKYQQSTVATGVLNSGTAPSPFVVMAQASLTSVSILVPLNVELFGTWSASSASNTTTVQQFQVFGLN